MKAKAERMKISHPKIWMFRTNYLRRRGIERFSRIINRRGLRTGASYEF
jgi:hypothetical protein